ncbi:MAG: MurR/RpiR family transcriptional regulator [Clostridia bacterium]|nr:MurR/RpiR family transcriptional regulator [Clostridia bacterium]MBR2926043.1 MurR/RpiR family transcriptional regulator [Clostridia bacterium]
MKRDLLKAIEDEMHSFSKGQRLIASYVLSNYDKAAYMTASKLGAVVGVSESTVVRFANELGYEGYPEFQHSLQEIIRSHLTSFQRIEVTNNLIGDGNVLDKVLLSDAEKLRHTMEEIDHASFEQAVDRIVEAKNIYIIGVRSSAHLAGFLNYSLRMIFDNVKFVQTTSGSEMFEQIMQIDKGDTMIAISFPRYSKRIINAVEYARSRGADVVALTDSTSSPIASFASQLLIAQSDMASFVDSLVAPLSIINAIIVAVARKRQEDVTERLHRLEEVWDRYDVYDKKGK